MNGKATWIIIGLIVSWSITAAGAVWAFAADRAEVVSTVEQNQAQLADHEKRIRKLERVANDVRWIRRYLEDAK